MPLSFHMHAPLSTALSIALVSLAAVASAAGQSTVSFDQPGTRVPATPATRPGQAGDVYQTLPVVKLAGVKRVSAIAADENTVYLALRESNEILVVDLAGTKVTTTSAAATMLVGPTASGRVRWLVARNTAEGVELHQYKLAGN